MYNKLESAKLENLDFSQRLESVNYLLSNSKKKSNWYNLNAQMRTCVEFLCLNECYECDWRVRTAVTEALFLHQTDCDTVLR